MHRPNKDCNFKTFCEYLRHKTFRINAHKASAKLKNIKSSELRTKKKKQRTDQNKNKLLLR